MFLPGGSDVNSPEDLGTPGLTGTPEDLGGRGRAHSLWGAPGSTPVRWGLSGPPRRRTWSTWIAPPWAPEGMGVGEGVQTLQARILE